MIRCLYAKSQYFLVAVILQEMQEVIGGQFFMLSLQNGMTKAIIIPVSRITRAR